jgi:hypothetical protein
MDQVTNYQLEVIGAIEALYDGRALPEGTDKKLQALDQQVRSQGVVPDLKSTIRLVHIRDGRRFALSNLYDTFIHYRQAGGKLDRWHFLHTAELYEIQRLSEIQEVEAALIRGTSALEHTLEEKVDLSLHWPSYDPAEDHTRFVKLIDWAFEDGLVTYQNLKLHHLVRTVRNRFAHHTWLDRGDDFEILVLAVRVVIYLMDAHVQSQFDVVKGIELQNFIEGLDPEEEYLEVIEDKHGWKFKELQKRWHIPET